MKIAKALIVSGYALVIVLVLGLIFLIAMHVVRTESETTTTTFRGNCEKVGGQFDADIGYFGLYENRTCTKPVKESP